MNSIESNKLFEGKRFVEIEGEWERLRGERGRARERLRLINQVVFGCWERLRGEEGGGGKACERYEAVVF